MGRIAGSCGSRSPWGTRPRRSPYNDTLGICFAYQKYLTVTMPGVSQKFPQKSCAELPATAPSGDPYGSARDNGCYPLAESLSPARAARRSSGSRTVQRSGTCSTDQLRACVPDRRLRQATPRPG
jgi:hypothetical protein